jgi:hypothetical protein
MTFIVNDVSPRLLAILTASDCRARWSATPVLATSTEVALTSTGDLTLPPPPQLLLLLILLMVAVAVTSRLGVLQTNVSTRCDSGRPAGPLKASLAHPAGLCFSHRAASWP